MEATILGALKNLFTSSTTWTVITGLIVTFAAKYGINVDSSALYTIEGGFVLLVFHQAITNTGTGAAKINATANIDALKLHLAERTSTGANVVVKKPEGGFIDRSMMLTLALFTALFFSVTVVDGCKAEQQVVANGPTCAGKQLTWSLLGQVAADLMQPNYEQLLLALAATNGLAVVNCITQTVIASQPTTAAGSGSNASAVLSVITEHGNAWLAGHAQ